LHIGKKLILKANEFIKRSSAIPGAILDDYLSTIIHLVLIFVNASTGKSSG